MKNTINLTTDAVIFAKHNKSIYVLLIQRKNEPYQHKWAFPGGFVDQNEKVIKACQRELKEETSLHLDIHQFDFLDFFDAIHRDPRNRTISFAYTCLLNSLQDVKGGDDAASAKWIKMDDVNTNELAFDLAEILIAAKKHFLIS